MSHNDQAAAAKVALGIQYERTIEVASEIDPALKGSVTFSLPTGKDFMRIAVLQHDLREGRPFEELDGLSGGMLVMLSTLSVIVRRAPDWWYRTEGTGKDAKRLAAPELIADVNVLWDIWGGFVTFRDTFPRLGNDQADGQAAGGADPLPAVQAPAPAAV
jgi:hypothetical protein